MNKSKILGIFNELLEEWYWSEEVVINDRSINCGDDSKYLEERKREYRERFSSALNE